VIISSLNLWTLVRYRSSLSTCIQEIYINGTFLIVIDPV